MHGTPKHLKARIVSDPEIMSGTPVVEGTRVPAITIVAMAESGESISEIFLNYPSLPIDGIQACLKWSNEWWPVCGPIGLSQMQHVQSRAFDEDTYAEFPCHVTEDSSAVHSGIFIHWIGKAQQHRLAVACFSLAEATLDGQDAYRITGLAVDPVWQGLGLGRIEVETALGLARVKSREKRSSGVESGKEFSVLWLTCSADQVEFFERLGFERHSTTQLEGGTSLQVLLRRLHG